MINSNEKLVQFIGFSALDGKTPIDGGAYILYHVISKKYRFDSCIEKKESDRRFDTKGEAITYYKRYINHKAYTNIKWKAYGDSLTGDATKQITAPVMMRRRSPIIKN